MRLLGVALLIVALAGCGSQPSAVGPSPAPAEPTPAPAVPAAAAEVFCHHNAVPLSALDRPRPATELSASGRQALKGREVRPITDLASWSIVTDTATRLALIRRLGAGTEGGEYELLVVERFGTPKGWHLRSSSRCDLRNVPRGLGAATLELDPAAPAPTADSREVRLLVTEEACSSGQSAEGRIRLTVERTETEIRLTVGVARAEGDAWDCQGNPATPYTADLGEPLGARALVDATSHPSRVLGRS